MKFENTSCSQCGCDLGPGNSGVSHCEDHAPKNTPGPWTLTTTEKYAYINARINGERTFILQRAREHYNPKKLAQIDADCRLIAAAPELLDALRKLMRFCESTCVVRTQEGQEIVHPTFAQAEDAITKATGEAA